MPPASTEIDGNDEDDTDKYEDDAETEPVLQHLSIDMDKVGDKNEYGGDANPKMPPACADKVGDEDDADEDDAETEPVL